jgi:hypothetical protein
VTVPVVVQVNVVCAWPPDKVKFVGDAVAVTVGSAVTVIVTVFCAVAPSSSVTVNVAVYIPALENEWLGLCELLDIEPSPKSHE